MNKLLLIMAVAFGSLMLYTCSLSRKIVDKQREIDRLTQNVWSLNNDRRYFLIRDSLRAVETSALLLSNRELKQLRAADAKLIADLKQRPKDVITITKTETITRDSVRYVFRDSCFTYADKWCSFSACLKDTSLIYSVRDSVASVLSVEYQRRFLWWRWKPRYRVTTTSFNPNTTIINTESIVLPTTYIPQ